MQTQRIIQKNVATYSAAATLKSLGRKHYKKLFFTLLLVIAENITYLLYPLLAGFALNAILAENVLHAVFYSVMVFMMWAIAAARRSVDTRTFARIYAELAVPVILAQRLDNQQASTVVARVALSREFVNFFEKHLPVLINAVASISGAAIMLLVLEFWIGVTCLAILTFFALFLRSFTRRNDELFLRLNNRLEKEVGLVSYASRSPLDRHYYVLARLRVCLSDREALGYLSIGIAAAMLFGMAILMMTLNGEKDAGHIYAVMTYMWMFAMSLDDGPELLENYSQLKDIGKRINTGQL